MERASLDGRCAFRGHFAQPHDASFEMPERFQLLTSRCSSEMQLAAGIVSQRASDAQKRARPETLRTSNARARTSKFRTQSIRLRKDEATNSSPSGSITRRSSYSARGSQHFPDALLRWASHIQSRGRPLYNTMGNTGYLNAILQVITHTPPIAIFCLGRGHSASCSHVGFCAMCLVEAHVRSALSLEDTSPLSPDAIVQNLPEIGDFDPDTLQDAHELFLAFLSAIEQRGSDADSSSHASHPSAPGRGGGSDSSSRSWRSSSDSSRDVSGSTESTNGDDKTDSASREARAYSDAGRRRELLVARDKRSTERRRASAAGLVGALFEGKMRTRVTCDACGAMSDRTERFRDLTLDVYVTAQTTGCCSGSACREGGAAMGVGEGVGGEEVDHLHSGACGRTLVNAGGGVAMLSCLRAGVEFYCRKQQLDCGDASYMCARCNCRRSATRQVCLWAERGG